MKASDGGAAGLNAQDERLIEGSTTGNETLGGGEEVPTKLDIHDRLGSDAHEYVVRLLPSGGRADWRNGKRWQLGPVIVASQLRSGAYQQNRED